jgi:hypothetical protein
VGKQQVRSFRIFQPHGEKPCVQYGYWAPSATGMQERFRVLREWPASDWAQAESLKKQIEIDVLLDPELQAPVDAEPLLSRMSQRRDMRQMPADIKNILQLAHLGLSDPLPDMELSHQRLGTVVPQEFRAGRHFSTYLADPIYTRLVAMAAAAGVGRNRMIEALILAAEEFLE